jgi:muramoyltetrapeptide carboxypeptidase
MITPPPLKQGDKIGIMAPARKITSAELVAAIKIIRDRGFEVELGKTINAADNQFAGTDGLRTSDFQYMLDNEDIKAVIFARGGYGCLRIIDGLNFDKFIEKPKWLAGYSDICVIHSHINSVLAIQSLHSTMPINFIDNTDESLTSLFNVLLGKTQFYKFPYQGLNSLGSTKAEIVGGNLSVLYSLLGSKSFPDLNNKILFFEDLDEYLYHIDRMMTALVRAGKLSRLSGLLVGGMTKMNDNDIPFGKNAEEIIKDAVADFKYPIAFGFPAGHIDDNRAIVLGGKYEFLVGTDFTTIRQLSF